MMHTLHYIEFIRKCKSKKKKQTMNCISVLSHTQRTSMQSNHAQDESRIKIYFANQLTALRNKCAQFDSHLRVGILHTDNPSVVCVPAMYTLLNGLFSLLFFSLLLLFR